MVINSCNGCGPIVLIFPSARFLLNYLTRDEVGLLKAGNGSFVEVRDAIIEYPETSPLYGLIQYRRKKVLLKYLPEGTSRLLQGTITESS